MRLRITIVTPDAIALSGGLPALITTASDRAAWHFLNFFTVTLRNPNTRKAYLRAVHSFLAWCEGRGPSA